MGIRSVFRNPAPCRFVAVTAGPLGGVKLALGPPRMPSQSLRPTTRSRSPRPSSNSRSPPVRSPGAIRAANDLTLHRHEPDSRP